MTTTKSAFIYDWFDVMTNKLKLHKFTVIYLKIKQSY